jgi:hypothetical protein
MRTLFQRIMGDWMAKVPAPTEEKVTFVLKLGDMDVATLSRDQGEWVFKYTEAFQLQQKIQPIIGFSNKFKEYRSAELWPFFQIRVPSLEQTDVQNYLRQNNLEQVDQSTLLEHFGRRSISNPFELIPSTR